MKLLITELDNTLYDWVSFYSQSFSAMAEELSKEINVPLDILLSEYKVVHQKFGNSEKPFATLELPFLILGLMIRFYCKKNSREYFRLLAQSVIIH